MSLAWLALALGRCPGSRAALWAFNLWGTADLLFAFYQGIRRDDTRNQKRRADEAEHVKEEDRARGVGQRQRTEARPEENAADRAPGDEAERHAHTKHQPRGHIRLQQSMPADAREPYQTGTSVFRRVSPTPARG